MVTSPVRKFKVIRKYNSAQWSELVGKTGKIGYKAYLHPVPNELCSTKMQSEKLVSPIAKVAKTLDMQYGICACNTQQEAEDYAVSMNRDTEIMEVFMILCIGYLKPDDKQGECYEYVTPLRIVSTYKQAIDNTGKYPGEENKIGIVPIAVVYKESENGPYIVFRVKTGLITRELALPDDVIFSTERERYRTLSLDDSTILIYNTEKPL
jgi:hypothetical protein